MGGSGASLDAALTYSQVVFSGAILVWLFNSLANVIRGTGNMAFPALVTCSRRRRAHPVVAVFDLRSRTLSKTRRRRRRRRGDPLLCGGRSRTRGLFGIRPKRGSAPPARHPAALGAVRRHPPRWRGGGADHGADQSHDRHRHRPRRRIRSAAIAGYGTGSRLEYLLIPLVFGLGGPLVAMVGTNIGAGRPDRALRVAWIGAAIAAALCEIIGFCAAAAPRAWLSLFGTDPAMIDAGSRYLHAVGPVYGLFGFGMALYFASQGAGPTVVAVARQYGAIADRRRRRLARLAPHRQHDRCVHRLGCCTRRFRSDQCGRSCARRLV